MDFIIFYIICWLIIIFLYWKFPINNNIFSKIDWKKVDQEEFEQMIIRDNGIEENYNTKVCGHCIRIRKDLNQSNNK